MEGLRKAAVDFGIKFAAKQFDGRKGHGQIPRVTQRHFNETQLAAALGAAFEQGAEYAAAHMAGDRATLMEALERLVRDAMPEEGVMEGGKFTGRWKRVLPSTRQFRTDLLGKSFEHAVEALRAAGSLFVKENS